MIHTSRVRWTAAATLVVGAALLAAWTSHDDEPQAATAGVSSWSDDVWDSALRGDGDALSAFFESISVTGSSGEPVERFRESYELHQRNVGRALEARESARAEAIGRMREHIEEDHLAQALRDAVEVQTLSDDFDDALTDPEISRVIRWAQRQVPELEGHAEWLAAQELLYRLRTIYEDTDSTAEYERYDEALDRVNRRVALLARYAPRRLHELRAALAERDGEEPLSEFNAANVVDWRERLVGIDHRMLKGALRIAADEHIESVDGNGWQPLLEGGLEALKIFATTISLRETFPNLGVEQRVRQWVEHLDAALAELEATPAAEIDRWTLQRIVDDLIRVNERTIRVNDAVIFREFGDGAIDRLDQFTEIIWPEKIRRFEQATEGNFVGVGILIRHDEKRQIKVVNPLEGTPAYFAGIKPEDVIVEVDGDSTVGWSLNDAVDRITGPRGEPVTLAVKREGTDGVIEIPIDRDIIKLRSVMGWWKQELDESGEPQWDWYVDPVARIAYVRLSQFTGDTFRDLRDAWAEMSKDGPPAGLILDLRFNPGGLLTSAVQISNLFVPSGVIVSGEDKHGRKAWPDQRAREHLAELSGVPTVVLVNKGSASASEIVAGCLQAHGGAVIVGERSFGKGSVQTVHNISSRPHEARLKLTTQYYRLPATDAERREGRKGRLVHKRPGATKWGVDPDIIVKMTPAQVVDSLKLRQDADIIPENEDGDYDADSPDRPDINRLLSEGMDSQLEMALLILQARALDQTDQHHARK